MGRRLGLLIASGLGLALVALVGLFAVRTAALEALLKERLAARGVAVGALEVVAVGLRETRIEGVRLGAPGELSARAVRVEYAPQDVIRGRLARVAIEGLVLELDLTGSGAPLGSLQPLLRRARDGAAPALPLLELSQARIEAETPLGAVRARLDGEAWPAEHGALASAFTVAVDGEPGRLSGAVDLVLAADGGAAGHLVIEDGALALPGAELGGLLGKAAYTLVPDGPPALDAELSARRIDLPEAAFKDARLTARTEAGRLMLEGAMSGADGHWTLGLKGALEDYLAAPQARFDLSALAEAGAAFWPLLALPEPAAGRAHGRLTVSGRLPPLARAAAADAGPAAWLAQAALTGRATLRIEHLSYPGRVAALSGELDVEADLEDGAVSFELPHEARLDAAGLAVGWLRQAGLPEAMIPLLEPGGTLALSARGAADTGSLTSSASARLVARRGARVEAAVKARLGFAEGLRPGELSLDDLRVTARAVALPWLRLREITARGSLAGAAQRLSGELDISARAAQGRVGDLRAEAIEASLRASVETAPGGVTLRLRAPGRVSLAALRYGERLRVDEPVRLTLERARAAFGTDGQDRVRLDHELALAVEPVRLALLRARAAPLVAALSPGRAHVSGVWRPRRPYEGSVRWADAGLVLPEEQIALEGVQARLAFAAAPPRIRAEFEAAELKDRAQVPRFAPISARGEVRGDGDVLDVTIEAQAAGGAARLTITGAHRIAEARGAARIALEPIRFAPEGVQPGALVPSLEALRSVSGTVRAGAALAWEAGRMRGEADLNLQDLSFESDAADVSGLDLALRLARLFPPGSPPGQRLTIERVDPGVPLDDVEVRFQVRRGAPTRLAIEHGGFGLSGGRVRVRDITLDPAVERQDLALEVEGLDLAELFRLLDIEGLSGSGRLSGRIPLVLGREAVVIAGGRLEAVGPGTLRLRSEHADRALAGAGEPVELMLRALENFHYDELSLSVDKPAAADARLTLVLLGRNPDLLDGYPFRFNINLEGNTGRLVAALGEAYSLSNRMLRRAWRFAR